MKRLYFVRHGESVLNRERVHAGQQDTPLTDLGREQARLAGDTARAIKFDIMVSSPLIRALETAQLIAEVTGYPLDRILTNPLFMERSFGSFEGHSWDETPDEGRYPDIETETALLARARAGLEFLRELEAEDVLLVAHGSLGRALFAAVDQDRTYSDFDELPNAEIVQLV